MTEIRVYKGSISRKFNFPVSPVDSQHQCTEQYRHDDHDMAGQSLYGEREPDQGSRDNKT